MSLPLQGPIGESLIIMPTNNNKAYVTKNETKPSNRKSSKINRSEQTKEDEQLKLFAQLIIDIYFDQLHQHEKNSKLPTS